MVINKEIKELNLDDILPNRFQPRIKFDKNAINELSESIKKHGVIHPIIVRQIGDKYEIIAGERRYKGSRIAGKTTIPAIVIDLDDKTSAEIALIENVQREDLTPIEEAISYKKILNMGYLTQEELAEKINKKQSTISNKLRLLNLSDAVQESLLENKISERHARSLLRLENNQKQEDMLKRIIEERMTVRKTDIEIDKMVDEFNKIEKSEDTIMNNQKDFNIPSVAIINDDIEELQIDDIEEIIEQPMEMKEITPGFLDIDTIEKLAEDIIVERPINNIDELLKTDESIETVNEVEEEIPVNLNTFFNQPMMPETAAIEESKITTDEFENLFDYSFLNEEAIPFPTNTKNESTETVGQNEFLMPNLDKIETKIKTDNVDFKVVVNTIRECASKIERDGYMIEVEEIDFENYYQVIFKVQK